MTYIYDITDSRWDDVSETYDGFQINFTNLSGGAPTGAAASRVVNLLSNSTSIFNINLTGDTYIGGKLGLGGAAALYPLDINDSTTNIFRAGITNITDLEGITLRYANKLYPITPSPSAQSASLYGKVDPTGTFPDNQFIIFGEVTSNQADGESAFMKINHYGAGDAIYVPLFTSSGVAFEAATFTDGTKGIISTIQAAGLANSTLFNAVWGQATIPLYGMYYADDTPANSFTIRKRSGASDTDTQIRIWEADISRERLSIYNDGGIKSSSVVATSGATIKNSPYFNWTGAYWTGAASSDLGIRLRTVVSAVTPKYRLTISNNTSTEMWSFDQNGNIKSGNTAAERATTESQGTIVLFNAPQAPVGTLANGVTLYASGGKLFAMDAGGAATQLTP